VNDEFFGPENDGFPAPEGAADGAEELFADLGDFQTGFIPVDAVLKHGHAIRVRRRVVGSGALAVAAALSIGVPVAIAGGGNAAVGVASGAGPNGVYAASSTGGRVTVNPTPFRDGKGHFTGTVDGKKWSVDFDNQNCDYITWSCGFLDLYPWDKDASLAFNSSWGLQGQPDDYTLFLDKNVARATVTLQDGEVLRLAAVPTANTSVILFALPFGLGVSKVELFDAHDSQIAYMIPFNIKGSASVDGHWYKPGETPPKDSGSVELAHGEFGPGEGGTISAYAGPAGPCFVQQAGGAMGDHPMPNCVMQPVLTGSSTPPVLTGRGDMTGIQHTGEGLAGPKVDRLELDFSDGTRSPVAIKSLGGYRFFGYFVPEGKSLAKITAFDAAGVPLPVEKSAQTMVTEQKWPSPATTR